MLQTVEAEIEINGVVRLLEPLHITKKTRAIVTVLDEPSVIAPPRKLPSSASRQVPS